MRVNTGMGNALLVIMNTQNRLINLCFLEFLLFCHLVEIFQFHAYFINNAVINHAMKSKLDDND
jgi:hypothetical protein